MDKVTVMPQMISWDGKTDSLPYIHGYNDAIRNSHLHPFIWQRDTERRIAYELGYADGKGDIEAEKLANQEEL